MPRPTVEYLDIGGDEALDAHLGHHGLCLDDIYDLLEGGDWVSFPNKAPHPRTRRKFVGPLPNGRMIAVVLRETDRPGTWEPVTAYDCGKHDLDSYRKGRKHQHG